MASFYQSVTKLKHTIHTVIREKNFIKIVAVSLVAIA
jgi:hypothetical protein